MLNKGIGAKAADDAGRTLLHHAAAANATDVMDLLVERGASFAVADMHGYTVRPATWERSTSACHPLVEHCLRACGLVRDRAYSLYQV